MTAYKTQVNRIREKLTLAKQADPQLKVFGAESHKYQLSAPTSEADIKAFEQKHHIQLPDAYKTFLLEIGNGGGGSFRGSAAGPFYGIYPLGNGADELTEQPEIYLREPANIHPGMTDEYWAGLVKIIEEDEDISDEAYSAETSRIFSGILPIGSQGCTYLHALVLGGPHAGKVVNIDTERQKPSFTYEANFLDWYERWLDEIISGDLLQDGASWFGYGIGGDSTTLLKGFYASAGAAEKKEYLDALLRKRTVEKNILDTAELEYRVGDETYKESWLSILTKFDYTSAKPYLTAHAETDLLTVVQLLNWYAKDQSTAWAPLVEKHITSVNDEETFRFCTYLLGNTDLDYGSMIVPFTQHANVQIRVTAHYTLGKLKNKADYIPAFITGLTDEANYVVHTALQSLADVKDPRLFYYYKKILERFPVEQDYILANLGHRLKENNVTEEDLRNMRIDP